MNRHGLPLKMWQYLLLLFYLCTSWRLTAAIYSENGPVALLNDDLFHEQVLKRHDPWLVNFYQPDCQHCEAMVPEYNKVAHNLEGIIKVGAVNCVKEPKLCSAAEIKALPTIKWYSWEPMKNPYTGKWYKESPAAYTGEPSAKKVTEFATAQLPASFVHNITSGSSADSFFGTDNKLAKVVLFSSKGTITPLYKSLAIHFRGRLQFAQAKAADEALCARFGASVFPTVFVQLTDGEHVQYDGAIRAEPIKAFLEQYAVAAADPSKDGGSAEKEAELEEARAMWVKKLESVQFEEKVLQDEDMWLVAILGGSESEECALHQQKWKQASATLTGMVKIGELSTATDKEAAKLAQQYGVLAQVEDSSRCLAVLLFSFGEDKAEQEPEVYMGPLAGKEVSAFALDALPEMFVQHLVEATATRFGEINPQKPKVILFTNKTETSPMYKALASNFYKYITFGQVHSSEMATLEKFNVTKVPHISFILGRQMGNGEVETTVNSYRGPLKYPQLGALCNQLASFALGMHGEPSSEAEVPEVTDDAGFEKRCVKPGRLCVVGLFNGPSKVKVLQSVAAIWEEGGQFSFFWVDASRAPSWSPQLGVSSSSVPSVAILSPGKRRFTVLAEEFTAENLQGTLEGLLVGKVRTSVLEAIPTFSLANEGGPQAETQQVEEAPVEVEEEFSLDDILGEELEDADALGTKGQRLLEVEKELEEERARQRAEEEAAKASSSKKKKKKKVVKKKAAKDEL